MTANEILRQSLNREGFVLWHCDKCGQEYCDLPGLHSDRLCGYCAAETTLNISVLDSASDFVAPPDPDEDDE